MGKDVQDTGGARFRVIDPPRVTPEPVAPRRIALLGVAFGVAVLFGLFSSFLANQIWPMFHDARSLRQISKRTMLGLVSMLPNERTSMLRRRHAYMFAGGLGGLVASCAAIFAIALMMGRAA